MAEDIKHDGKTLREVQSEYGVACAHLGDLVFRYDQLDMDISRTKLRIEKLVRTAKKFNKPAAEPSVEVAPEQGLEQTLDA